jgi:lipopolysaccharide transport system ATP-binding protein
LGRAKPPIDHLYFAVSVPRIALVGGFDVSNFGDLLFPFIAERELTERLEGPEFVRYSLRDMEDEAWPHCVRSLGRLPEEICEFDLLVIGGGHLIRFDKEVAPGYRPTDASVHHPTGFWLTPTLLAVTYGVPVAWNAVGSVTSMPAWGERLLGLAVRAADYVAVRDEPSAGALASAARGAPFKIVPDSAFGLRRLVPQTPSERFWTFCDQVGLTPPYVILQPSPSLVPFASQVGDALSHFWQEGRSVLELPIGPALGDKAGVLELDQPMTRASSWPDPLLLAEIVSQADAVVAKSLHLSITALVFGVPVHCPSPPEASKYAMLDGLSGVHFFGASPNASKPELKESGRAEPGPQVTERMAQLSAHWDTIADLCGRGPLDASFVAETITAYTSMLDTHTSEVADLKSLLDISTSEAANLKTDADARISDLEQANVALDADRDNWRAKALQPSPARQFAHRIASPLPLPLRARAARALRRVGLLS